MQNESTHSMKRRSPGNNYNAPGTYHITLTVHDRKAQSLGVIKGDLQYPDGHPNGPRVELSALGRMVEDELLHSITEHYPVIEIQDYVIMPEHMHFLAVVKNSLISKNGHTTHLGQVIAGFKSGCNRRYWEITGQRDIAAAGATAEGEVAAKPLPTMGAAGPSGSGVAGGFAASAPEAGAKKLRYSSGRSPLFSEGYVDVIPLKEGQLETQRAYIHANPRNRLLRQNNPTGLHPQRKVVDTLVTPSALRGYPIILIVDNGFPPIYHPSEARLSLCASNQLLLLSPWAFRYQHNNEEITVAECKAMNCIAQALCHKKDDWWK